MVKFLLLPILAAFVNANVTNVQTSSSLGGFTVTWEWAGEDDAPEFKVVTMGYDGAEIEGAIDELSATFMDMEQGQYYNVDVITLDEDGNETSKNTIRAMSSGNGLFPTYSWPSGLTGHMSWTASCGSILKVSIPCNNVNLNLHSQMSVTKSSSNDKTVFSIRTNGQAEETSTHQFINWILSGNNCDFEALQNETSSISFDSVTEAETSTAELSAVENSWTHDNVTTMSLYATVDHKYRLCKPSFTINSNCEDISGGSGQDITDISADGGVITGTLSYSTAGGFSYNYSFAEGNCKDKKASITATYVARDD